MIPVGVVGVGSMGRHHARVYRELPDTELIGVYDVDSSRAREVANEHGTKPMSLDGLVESAEMVSIVVPTQYHRDIAERAIQAGTHILVEKPLAPSPEEGRAIVDAAEDAGLTLQVGHIERFNPAVRALAGFADDLDVIAMEAKRLGPPVDRDDDEGVVTDLMIHDIDVARSLMGEQVVDVDATGTADGDYVTTVLTFESGVVATLTASRVTAKKVREFTVTADECRVDLDYTSQDVTITRQTRPEYISTNGGIRFRSETVVERPTVDNGEPLKKELSSFVESCREGSEPAVTGQDGLRALDLAQRVKKAADY